MRRTAPSLINQSNNHHTSLAPNKLSMRLFFNLSTCVQSAPMAKGERKKGCTQCPNCGITYNNHGRPYNCRTEGCDYVIGETKGISQTRFTLNIAGGQVISKEINIDAKLISADIASVRLNERVRMLSSKRVKKSKIYWASSHSRNLTPPLKSVQNFIVCACVCVCVCVCYYIKLCALQYQIACATMLRAPQQCMRQYIVPP